MQNPRDLPSTKRFILEKPLGSGGMGRVYEAYDRERNERVALKTLMYASPSAIYNLKQEFRALADVAHPNLVSLYELFCEDDQWFFTMELVKGVTFLDYARCTRRSDSNAEPGAGAIETGLDVERLRGALRQLVEGVRALHAAGKVHRDLKPSNVLVTRADRVVILDFGISRDLDPSFQESKETSLAGTAFYMAPEQADGQSATPASDWYAIGVMLYEALTGQLPFEGVSWSVLYQKYMRDPVPPDQLVPGVPSDLAELCQQLLSRDPAQRPTADDLLRCLGSSGVTGAQKDPSLSGEQQSIVGREQALAALEDAFQMAERGVPVSVYVHGPSGIGKSTVVQHFLNELVSADRAVVLSGRCYDRESMPYKAMDGVIDSLTRFLRLLPQERVEGLLPRDVPAVARLFPVLLRVKSVERAPQRSLEIPDPLTLRRRAFAALRELFARITDRQPLVIHIDDFHWADADSIALLEDILRPPDAPAVLLILSLRSEEISLQPFLASLLAQTGTPASRELVIGPLPDEEARKLVRTLLPYPIDDPIVDVIVREAEGSPFFIEQLARDVLESESTAHTTGLAEMLEARLARLPPGSRSLLQILAVAGHPIDFEAAHQAADLVGDARALVGVLRVARMIRSSGSAERIELYHDRIREEIASGLEAETVRRIHLRLIEALSAADDPEALFEHSVGAGQHEEAARHAIAAAQRAAAALAFDRAARFYGRALDLSPASGALRTELNANLGDALANAGRPAEAARAFLAASATAAAFAALEYRRRAAEQLLIGGYNDQGLQVMRELLAAVGLYMPSGPKTALLMWIFRRLHLWLRGYGYSERPANSLGAFQLLRMDICFAMALGLAMVDSVAGSYFATRYLLLALKAGEPYRVARALAFEAGFISVHGGPVEARARALHQKAHALAERLGSERELALSTMTIGASYCQLGEFKQSAELCIRAEQLLQERCTGVIWELTTCQIYLLAALTYLGETAEVERRVRELLAAAEDRSNLFQTIELQTRQHIYWLIRNQPDEARARIKDALTRWTRKGFHRQHYNALFGLSQVDLYVGDPAAAHRRVEGAWPALKHSLILRVQLFLCEMLHLRARCALAVAARDQGNHEMLELADRIAGRIAREKMTWANPLAVLIRAATAHLRGNAQRSEALLLEAAAGFDTADMGLYAAVTRRRLGQLLGGEQGAQLVAAAESFMRSQKIQDPDRMTDLLASGFPERSG